MRLPGLLVRRLVMTLLSRPLVTRLVMRLPGLLVRRLVMTLRGPLVMRLRGLLVRRLVMGLRGPLVMGLRGLLVMGLRGLLVRRLVMTLLSRPMGLALGPAVGPVMMRLLSRPMGPAMGPAIRLTLSRETLGKVRAKPRVPRRRALLQGRALPQRSHDAEWPRPLPLLPGRCWRVQPWSLGLSGLS